MTQQQAHDIVDKHLADLGEHFEAVQILVSDSDGEGTVYYHRGSGNWYARVGMAREFLKQDQQIDQAIRLAEQMNPDDD